jgi:hypothetical protein
MAQNCENVFLDLDGNPAQAYYNNLPFGEDVALNKYLEYMGSVGMARFQKMPFQDVVKKAKEHTHFSKDNAAATALVMKYAEGDSEFDNDAVAKTIVVRLKAKDLMVREFTKYGMTKAEKDAFANDSKSRPSELAKQHAEEYFDQNESELKFAVESIKNSWKFHNEEGKKNHDLIDSYVKVREETRLRDGDFHSGDIIGNIVQGNKSEAEDKNMLEKIETFIYSATKKMKNYEIITEMPMEDAGLKINARPDMIIWNKDTNEIFIYDFKFKQIGKEFIFSSRDRGPMSGPFRSLYNNKETQAALQLSVYKLMFERMGWTGSQAGNYKNSVHTFIVPIVGEPVEDNRKNIVKYERIKVQDPIKTTYYRSELAKMFAERNININKVKRKEDGKYNSPRDIIMNLTDGTYGNKGEDPNKLAAKMLNNLKTGDNGKEHFWDSVDHAWKEFKPGTTDDEKLKVFKDYIKKRKGSSDSLANNFIEYFKKPENGWPSEKGEAAASRAKQAANLLGSITSKDYKLEQLKNIHGFEDADPNILIALEEETLNARIICLSDWPDEDLPETQKDKNVFSKYIKDSTLKSKYQRDGMMALESNYKILEASMLALELKKNNYVSNIEMITHGTIDGRADRSGLPTVTSMSNMVPHLKIMKEVYKDKNIMSSDMLDLLSDKNLVDIESSKMNHFDRLMQLMEVADTFKVLNYRDYKKKIKNSFDSYQAQKTGIKDMLSVLYRAQKIMYGSLKAGIINKSPAELCKNREYMAICDAIVDLQGISLDPGAINHKKALAHGFELYGNKADPILQQMFALEQTTQQHAARRFKEFRQEHDKLLKKLMEDNNVTLAETKTTFDLHRIFNNLFINSPNSEDLGDIEKAFVLKDPDDVNLRQSERDYIKFFNKSIKEGFSMIMDSDQKENINKLWPEGMVPLMEASSDNKITRETTYSAKFSEWKKSMKHRGQKNTRQMVEEIFYQMNNPFMAQLKQYGVQNSDRRRTLLGIDEDGNKIADFTPKKLETNLQSILHSFMAECIIEKTYEPTLAVANAVHMKLVLEHSEGFRSIMDTSEGHRDSAEMVRQGFDKFMKNHVFGEYQDAGKLGKGIDTFNKVLTDVALVNFKQPIQESLTNFFTGQSVFLQSALSKLGSSDAFIKNPKSWATANNYTLLKFTSNEKKMTAQLIAQEFGFYNSDLTALKSKDLQMTRSGNLAQGKNLHFFNNLPFREFRSQMFFAKMADDGVLGAYSYKNDKLVYDESKDKRFSEIFKDGKLDKSPTTEQGINQLALYNAIKKDLKEEHNGINSDGSLGRPYSDKQVLVIKNYITRTFGSMDKDAKTEWSFTVFGRLFMKFKNWFVVKAGNYWSKGAMKQTMGKYVRKTNDETGEVYYQFEAQWHEGILQTLMHAFELSRQAINEGGKANFYKGVFSSANYNDGQKENLRRLLADIIVFLAWGAFIASIMGASKYWSKIAANSVADLNILQSTDSVSKGNPIALLAFVTNAFKNVGGALVDAAGGDGEQAAEQAFKLTGFTKSAYNIYND